jgi:hypothetical protein
MASAYLRPIPIGMLIAKLHIRTNPTAPPGLRLEVVTPPTPQIA